MPSPPPPPQPVPARPQTRSSNQNLGPPQQQPIASVKMGSSPLSSSSYAPMTGISFTNGGGFSFDKRRDNASGGGGSINKWATGGAAPGSYGARFYGDALTTPLPSPFSTSITMGESSSFFATSSNAFHLPHPSLSSSYQRRSYAAAARGAGSSNAGNLSSSFASMSFQPMSLGNSYSKSHVHSLMASQRTDAELTKAYECCGQVHEGLHQLLEHVEDAHPFADADNIGLNMGLNIAHVGHSGFSPITHAMDLDLEGVDSGIKSLDDRDTASASGSTSSLSPNPVPNYPLPPTASKPSTPPALMSPDPIAPLTISDVLKSPPDGEVAITTAALTASTSSSPPDALQTPSTSAHPSPVFAQPKINPARPGFLGSTSTAPRPAAQQRRFDRAFNEVVAGTSPNTQAKPAPIAVAPNVLFSSTINGFGNISATLQNAQKTDAKTEVPKSDDGPGSEVTAQPVVNGGPPPPGMGAEPPLPAPSLFSMHKPWRCPNPGCNKAYRQSNGLRYHQQKGQCDFAQQDAGDLGLSLEEAEERSRPFVCAVGAGCKKRYRQMNGLKYHYLNSGEHGQYGLRMLQNGTHPQPQAVPSAKKLTPNNTGNGTPTASQTDLKATPGTKTSTSTLTPTPRAAPYAVPNKAVPPISPSPMRTVNAGPGAVPKMGIFPTKPAIPSALALSGKASLATPAKDIPNAKAQLPSQRGKDAVLFSAVGTDPMGVNPSLEL
ncbi:hypothetical protein BD324DRAFT_642356 [Kockovaella imperatae]|uniref:C2H2-type domain-containing protein n=1 Tax=Kockovaella imperatae TaxID=4999 RepID=A0A1Y1UFI4_9TREE|nr:hypothetical protein BD324DRAFT_642356 [Kockovaella imperatae]ORX36788.1 hypothetical protein BD324DRAFT_642356 [Kockovaella imperatae]